MSDHRKAINDLVDDWRVIKRTRAGHVLFLKDGDYYYTLDADAERVTKVLGLLWQRPLLCREQVVPCVELAADRWHSYQDRLCKAGVCYTARPRFDIDNRPAPAPKPAPLPPPVEKQGKLFSGLDCLSGQGDLFPTDGTLNGKD